MNTKKIWIDSIRTNGRETTIEFDYFTPEYPEKLSILNGIYTYNFITKDVNITWKKTFVKPEDVTIDYDFLYTTLYKILEREGLTIA